MWNNSIEKTAGLIYNKTIYDKQIKKTCTNDNLNYRLILYTSIVHIHKIYTARFL